MSNELDLKQQFIHRDLSWLSFNERVLEEANDSRNPLLEKAKFLAIFVNNLDEFLMVRMAGCKRLADAGFNRKDQFGWYPQELLEEIKTRSGALIEKLYSIYDGKISKDLEKNKILIKKYDDLNSDQKKFVKRFFDTTVFPITTSLAVDQGHPFPVLPSKTIAFAVTVSKGSSEQAEVELAIIPIPKIAGRLIRLPQEKDETAFILIEEIIRNNLASFFRGYKIIGNCLFRVIRDSELSVEEEYSSDLLKALESEVKKRPRARVVHMEIEKNCDPQLLDLLSNGIGFPKENAMVISGDLDLTYLFELYSQAGKPQLSYPSYSPAKIVFENIFDKIKEGDFFLHFPYQSFQPTIDLLQAASKDPEVLAIKMTLYRVNEDSGIVNALKQAAKNKKQVTVLVELKARFDEERNISWAKELEESGCHVIYGMVGMKIHSKITLIVRREEEGIRRYVHLSTGNYNEKTAGVYTDIGYFTANDDFARDISDVFNVITGFSMPSRWKRVISSPNDLRQYFFEMIDNEIEFQKKYKNGLIIAKMNSLEDTLIIEKLYQASNAGVKIKLLVRGICCLIPGAKGLSENIEVRSIVGRFLEHSRIYYFNNNADYRIFLASADWMRRNFDKRIELLFEIYKDDLKTGLKAILDACWKDNMKSRELGKDRLYTKVSPESEKFNVQESFIESYNE